jgi:6-phosphogluconate dehydrogenase
LYAFVGLSEDEIRDRAAHKQAGRDADAQALDLGVPPAVIQEINSMFSGFDLSKAQIRPRRHGSR